MAMESLRELTPVSTAAARNLKNSLFFSLYFATRIGPAGPQ